MYRTAGLYRNVNPTFVPSLFAAARSRARSVSRIVVRHRLLAEHVLARLERRHREHEVLLVARYDVDDVDVVALDHAPVVGDGLAHPELVRRGLGQIGIGVAHGDDAAALVARPSREVSPVRPPPAPDHAYP